MMGSPYGRLLALQFREASFYTDDGRVGSVQVMRVHFRTPEGDVDEHDLPNGLYTIENKSLQFLAKWGYRPTDWPHDGAILDVEDDEVLVPLSPSLDGDGYTLNQNAMAGARGALEAADWFEPADTDDDGDDSQGPGGGGSPDPGTGNRAGIDAEQADEDSDVGIEVVVE